jgi:ABC-type uncharacterized transport system substrate-binding protein
MNPLRAQTLQELLFKAISGAPIPSLLAALLLAVGWCAPASWGASADGVLIVRSSDAVPYKEAEAALRERLGGGAIVCDANLKELSDKAGGDLLAHAKSVVAIGTPAARWLQRELPAQVRLVYCMVTGAEEAGLLSGRPAWGVTTEVALQDQVKLISETLPQARVLGMLYRSDSEESRRTLQAMTAALPPGWRIESAPVGAGGTLAAAIDSLTSRNIDLIWTNADARLYDSNAVRALLLSALRHKIPVWGFSPSFVRAGALLGVGVEPRAQGVQAADLLLNLLTRPADQKDKVESPREFQIAVNLIVAQQLDVTIPDAVTARAAFVFRPE